jgi:hypothetical protein
MGKVAEIKTVGSNKVCHVYQNCQIAWGQVRWIIGMGFAGNFGNVGGHIKAD